MCGVLPHLSRSRLNASPGNNSTKQVVTRIDGQADSRCRGNLQSSYRNGSLADLSAGTNQMTLPIKRTPGSRSPNDIDVAVGIKLRKLRLEAGMTLQDLADCAGLSHQQVQKYETGVNRISAGMLPVLADTLGVEFTEFYEDAERSGSDQRSEADKLRAECETWLRRTKSEDTLRAMSKVLKAMAS